MSNTKNYTKNECLKRALLIGGSASILMALFSPSILAEEVKSAIESKKTKEEAVEVIQVTGVRSSLESALLTKRDAASIVDAISAADMDSLPALNLGEALQALPGIQLNTDDGQRNSEISLRGLSGGFVKTMVEGQGFATPSRSKGPVGASNPFGAFEGGVFDGVTVIKSPTADMQEGGVAGIVNKKLQRALGKKDGQYAINIGTRYEGLSESFDKQWKFSGSKHLIKDKLAVAWKLAGSAQNYRRDTVNFSGYNALNTVEENFNEANNYISPEALDAYKELHGITHPLAIVQTFSNYTQSTENSSGDRFSGTANIEYQVTDAFKLGVNFLYTKRNLGESIAENFNVKLENRLGWDATHSDQRVILSDDINDTPIRLTDNVNPQYDPAIHHPDLATIPVYSSSVSTLQNASYTPQTKLQSFIEESKGIFLYGTYVTDDWLIDGTVSKSKSSNEFVSENLSVLHKNRTWAKYEDLDSRDFFTYAPTGIGAYLNTGKGNLDLAEVFLTGLGNNNYSDSVENPLLLPLDADDQWRRYTNGWSSTGLQSYGSTLAGQLNPYDINDYPAGSLPDPLEDPQAYQTKIDSIGGKSIELYTAGSVERPERDFQSGELNFERFIDLGNDAFKLTSVKFGGRHARELLSQYIVDTGAGGLDFSVLNKDTLFSDDYQSLNQAEYFNGNFANHANNNTGWLRIDTANLQKLLQANGLNPYDNKGEVIEEFEVAHPSTYVVRLDNRTGEPTYNLSVKFRQNFEADQVTNAVYLMGNFEGELAGFVYSGNMGVRHIETTNDIFGQGFDKNGKPISVLSENDYDHTLPVANLTIELSDDVVLRTAYSKGIVRPNLLAQSPSPQLETGGQSPRLSNSKADVVPYTSQNYDLSLEWYNRDGSAISIGMFEKNIEGKIETATICPVGDHEKWGLSPLEEVDEGGSQPVCREIGTFEDDDGEIYENRVVRIRSTYNSDIPITVNGYELAIQQKLDFLPYPWNGLGGVFNFTKIDLDAGDGLPMTRIAPYSYNLIGYYENDGASIRLAYNWQDEKLLRSSTSREDSATIKQSAGGRLDLSLGYRFNKSFNVNFRAYNLANTTQHEFFGNNEEAISKVRYGGRTYSASLSYRF